MKSLKCLVGYFCRLMLFSWNNEALFEIYCAKMKIHTPLNSNSCFMLVEGRINMKEENDPHFVPPLLGSLTCYCWPCWELGKCPGFPCRVWSQAVCPGRVCKQHQPQEGGVVQGEQLPWGTRAETTAALRPKVSSKGGQCRGAMVGRGGSGAVSLLQPSPWQEPVPKALWRGAGNNLTAGLSKRWCR